MNGASVVQFEVVAVLLALTPGADWAYAIAAGLRARSVVPSVLGMLFGYVVVIVVVALGIGALVAEYPVALTVLTLAGAVYLIWLGAATLRIKVGHVEASSRPLGDSFVAQFFRGAGISGINPKGLLLLLALLPQFTSPTAALPAAVQMLVLGGLHLSNCAVIYFAVAHLARRLLRSRPLATVIVTRLAGIVMVALGLLIITERLIEFTH